MLKTAGMRRGSAGQTGQDRLTGKGGRPRGKEIRPRPFAASQRSDLQHLRAMEPFGSAAKPQHWLGGEGEKIR